MAFESLFSTTLAARASATDTTLTVAAAPTITAGRVRIFNSTVSELCSFTGVSGSTLTGVGRNLSKTASPATVGGTGYVWPAGTKLEIVLMHDQIVDARVPVMPTFADTAARDAAIPSPVNGTLVYVTSVGQLMQYVSGNWQTVANGTDYATTRTATNATANNGEWYRDTGNSNALTYKSNAGTSYAFVVDATGKIAATAYDFSADTTGAETTKPVNAAVAKAIATANIATTSTAGSVERATDSETLLGGTAAVVPDADQLFDAWGYSISAGSTNTAAQSAAAVNVPENAYTKKKEIVCNLAGTYQISFYINGTAATNTYGRIYKNGVAFGTERVNSLTADTQYTESLAFASGDLIQLYAYQTGASAVTVHDFAVKYVLTQNLLATISSKFTVNL